MSEFLSRCFTPPVDLEIRGSDGRTVFGLAVPFDQEALVSDGGRPYREVFRMGAFTKTIAESGQRVKFLLNHDKFNRLPLGRATTLREDPSGLVGEFRVSATREGDEALELVRDGVLDSFSVGFAPVKHRGTSLVERTEVKLREVSITPFPSYAGALVGGLRIDDDDAAFAAFYRENFAALEAAVRANPDHLRTLLAEAAAGTSGEGAATQQSSEPEQPATQTTRCLPKHTRQLLLRQLREATTP